MVCGDAKTVSLPCKIFNFFVYVILDFSTSVENVEYGSPSGNMPGCNSYRDSTLDAHSTHRLHDKMMMTSDTPAVTVDDDSGCAAPPPSRGSTAALIVQQNRVLGQHELQVRIHKILWLKMLLQKQGRGLQKSI